ncbi:MAG: hypothetical protein WCY93_12225 [Anaerolineaceae bacterium]
MFVTTDRPEVGEFNGLVNGIAYHAERHAQDDGVETVDWTEPGLEITRLRLLSDPGFPVWDVSYVHGVLNGRHVDVRLPFSQLPKRGYKSFLYKEAKKTGKFIKGLFGAISTLN